MSDDRKISKPGLTIVGGQPREPSTDSIQVPVGFEMLLYRAARDGAFKKRLLAERQEAIADSGVQLRPSELATLKAVSKDALETMIERFEADSSPPRQGFMAKVAAAAASLAAGTAAAGGCALEEIAEQPATGGAAGAGGATTYVGGSGGHPSYGVRPEGGSGGSGGTAQTGGAGGTWVVTGGAGGAGVRPGGGSGGVGSFGMRPDDES